MEERSGGDTLAVTYLFAALFAPALVIGPLAGVMADRLERRRVMFVGYLTTSSIAIALALLSGLAEAPPLWAVYLLALLLGASFSVMGPSAGALVVNTVSIEDVASAISIQAAVQNMTRIAGPIMAVQVIGSGNFHVGFAGFALATLVAAGAITRVRVERHEVEADDLGVLGRVAAGYRHARERRPATLAIATTAVASVFGVAHTALIPSFTSEVLDRDPGEFAKIVASTGVGAIVGALTVGYSRTRPSLQRAALALTAYGICLAGFGLSGSLTAAALWQVGVGFFYFTTMTSVQTLIQQVVADSARGRVMSLFTIAWGGLVWVGTLMLGVVADPDGLGAGVRTTLLLTAGVLVAYGAVLTAVSGGMPTGADYE